MKNLRKILAVVLVICMAFSLMAVASAAKLSDYSDASSVTQKEAVDVLTRLGVLAGNGGKFDPTGTFTREQAAKVICYLMVGPTAAGVLTTATSSFSDVAATRWSAPFIEYCASKGVINGVGDGKFVPEAPVTGTAFAKMLLVAIGYGKNGEYTGANWEINALTDALSMGILTGSVNFSASATREQVARYSLNAVTIDYVAWSKDSESYIDKPNAVDMATNVFSGLAMDPATINGVGGYIWKNMFGVVMSDFVATDMVLGTSKNGVAIETLATSTSSFYIASFADTVNYFYNGMALAKVANNAGAGAVTADVAFYNTTDKQIQISTDNDPANGVDVMAKGVIVNFINTNFDNKAEKVTVIKKAVTTLVANPVVSVTTGNVTITGIVTNEAAKNVPGYADLKAGDVVLWYKDNLGVYNIQKATAVTGTVSNYVAGISFTAGGTTYTYSGLTGDFSGTVQGLIGAPGTTFYVDDGGYAVAVAGAFTPVTASNYLFVLQTGTSGFDPIAKVVMSDGTTTTIAINAAGAAAVQNKFFQFTKTDSTYFLTTVTSELKAVSSETLAGTLQNVYTAETDNPANITLNITKNTVRFLTEVNPALTTDLVANNSTVFLYQGATSVTAYTGITNVVNYTAAVDGGNIYALYKDGVAIMVYAVGGTAATSTSAVDWVFILDATPVVNYVSPSLTTYTYTALVNGVQTTITAKTEIFTVAGLWQVTAYTAGYPTTVDETSDSSVALAHYYTVANDKLAVSAGTVTADGTNYFVTSSTIKYFLIDHTTVAGVTTVYELTEAQVNALTSTGAKVNLVETSGTNAAIAAVYIYA